MVRKVPDRHQLLSDGQIGYHLQECDFQILSGVPRDLRSGSVSLEGFKDDDEAHGPWQTLYVRDHRGRF